MANPQGLSAIPFRQFTPVRSKIALYTYKSAAQQVLELRLQGLRQRQDEVYAYEIDDSMTAEGYEPPRQAFCKQIRGGNF